MNVINNLKQATQPLIYWFIKTYLNHISPTQHFSLRIHSNSQAMLWGVITLSKNLIFRRRQMQIQRRGPVYRYISTQSVIHLSYILYFNCFWFVVFHSNFQSTSLIFKSLHLHFPRIFHISWYPWNKIKTLSTKLLFKMDLLSVHTGSMRCFDKFPLNVWYCHGYLILAIYTLRKITIPVKIVTSTKPERITKVITQITAGLTCSHKDKILHSITETSSQLQICHRCHKAVATSYPIPRTSLNFWISNCPLCWR